MKKYSKLVYLFIFIISFCFISDVNAVYSDSQVGSYETELAKFPTPYQEKIKALHNIYPNAIFVAQSTFFDWNKYKEVEVSWNDMLKAEVGNKSLIYKTAKSEYKGSAYNSEKTWYYATQAAVEYYMNPYNFLDETYVFMFESQYYKDYHIKEGVEKILSGTFMSNKNCPGSDKTYAEVLLEAAAKYNVSPYMLAARLKQEQGTKGTSSLISGTYPGYENLYNYFNIQASGSNDTQVIQNGLKCANGTLTNSKGKKLCEGNSWTSPYLSIIGGAKFIYKQYVGINDTYNVKGQMTNYLQKWDPYGPVYGGHQYMQNIQAPYSEAYSTFKSYQSFANYKSFKYVFYISIFKGAPNVSNASTTNNNSNNNTSNNSNNVILGDVNKDGKISALDYVKIKNHIMGTNVITDETSKKAADYNSDGKISALDYVKIKNYIMSK